MALQSTFKSDLKKEQKLSVLLDAYYKKHLHHYHFERINDLQWQMEGIDLVFTHKNTQKPFYIDEKAQLDYVNEDLPTFAFELSYEKNGKLKKGWLFDPAKKTHFYALATAIYTDEPTVYTSCKITFVNREKLVSFLKSRNISPRTLDNNIKAFQDQQGKMTIDGLHHRSEGYLYFSNRNKAEKPINLILKLDFLIAMGVAKRLI